MKMLLSELRQVIREILEAEVEEQIEELQNDVAFRDVGSFIESKLENEEFDYSFVELQALARNEMHKSIGGKKSHVTSPSQSVVDRIKGELKGMGFKFVGREPLRKTRGVTSPVHGSHPFAGMAGGSGMGSSLDGPTGFGMGGGPGAMGGGYKWDPGSKRNLPMGAGKKR
jgi:hypothetical protein